MAEAINTIQDLAREVRAQITALEDHVDSTVESRVRSAISDQEIENRIKDMFPDLVKSLAEKGDAETKRLIRGWTTSEGSPDLVGTKYARLGWNVSDVEMLHNIMTSAHQRGLSGTGPSEELDRTFRAVSDGHYRSTALAQADDERAIEAARESGKLDEYGYQRAMHAIRAMDTQESGFGQQLIGAQYVGDLWEAARRESRVFNLFPSFETEQATAYIPVEVDIPEMIYVGESVDPNALAYATSKTGSQRVQVTPKKFMIHQVFSEEMREDAITPFIPFLRRQAGISMQHYSDSLVLNGDTTIASTGNINLDDDTPASTKHYTGLDGLRHAFLRDATGQGVNVNGAITYNALQTATTRMVDDDNVVDWSNPTMDTDLVYVTDPRTSKAISLLPETLTVDKYGAGATVLTGEQMRVGRHPLIVSQAMRLTEADGALSKTSANNTKGQIVVFNRNGFKVAWRRRVQLETERIPSTDQTRLVWSLRVDFARFTPTGAASGIKAVAGLYNISLP